MLTCGFRVSVSTLLSISCTSKLSCKQRQVILCGSLQTNFKVLRSLQHRCFGFVNYNAKLLGRETNALTTIRVVVGKLWASVQLFFFGIFR